MHCFMHRQLILIVADTALIFQTTHKEPNGDFQQEFVSVRTIELSVRTLNSFFGVRFISWFMAILLFSPYAMSFIIVRENLF